MPSLDLGFGTSIGRYRITRRLGTGGMAEVFLAHDPRLERDVAVKVLGDALLERPGYRVFLQREARAIAQLNHANIAQVYDIVDYQDRTCFVMEYVEGETLTDRLRRGAMPLEEVSTIGGQIAAAVAHAHTQGVLHCDLKPGNIFITRNGSAKVLDFGLARPLSPELRQVSMEIGASPTLVENRAGTPAYMSPEQYLGHALDERCDIYSLGVVLCEMATGQRPATWPGAWLTSPTSETLSAVATDSAVPPALRPILEKTLAPNPAERYTSALELQAALERLLEVPAATATAVSVPRHAPAWAPRRPQSRIGVTVLKGIAWTGAVLLCVTVLGLLNTTAYNITLERGQFASERWTDWLRWGFKSLVAPGVLATTLLIVLGLVRSLTGFAFRTLLPDVTTKITGSAHRLGLDHPTVLAQATAAAGLVALVAICWRFAPLIAAFFNPDGISTGDRSRLALLSSARYLEHRHYRMTLTVVVVLMTVALYHVLQQRRRAGPIGERASVAMMGAVLGVALLLLDAPYRLFLQGNFFERVQVASQPCYVIGARGNDVLVFCPAFDIPRNRVFARNDARLVPSGCHGNVFDAVPRCGPPE